MIRPHGSDELNPLFVMNDSEREALSKEAESLPSVVVSSAAAANAVMLGSGYFNPLPGYMNLADALKVAETMHTADGLFWPVPILNLVEDVSSISGARRIALRDPNLEGNPVLAVQEVDAVEEISPDQKQFLAKKIFGTDDTQHPGLAAFYAQGNRAVSGGLRVLNFSYFEKDFPGTFRTAYRIREEIDRLGWQRWWPSRPGIPCTGPTRSCAAWPKKRWGQTVS